MSMRTVLVERIHYDGALMYNDLYNWEYFFEVSRGYFLFLNHPLSSKSSISGAYCYQPRLRRVRPTTGVNFV